jgi:hypothetical protein
MFMVLPIENWAILYKLFMVMTAVFHPNVQIRKFCIWFSASWVVTGFTKAYYLDGGSWFMMQTVHELITILLVISFLSTMKLTKVIILTQAIFFVGLNTLQWQTLTDWFMPPDRYIWWNMVGFELILFSLWGRHEVLLSIKKHWTFENVTMVYIITLIILLAGNY